MNIIQSVFAAEDKVILKAVGASPLTNGSPSASAAGRGLQFGSAIVVAWCASAVIHWATKKFGFSVVAADAWLQINVMEGVTTHQIVTAGLTGLWLMCSKYVRETDTTATAATAATAPVAAQPPPSVVPSQTNIIPPIAPAIAEQPSGKSILDESGNLVKGE